MGSFGIRKTLDTPFDEVFPRVPTIAARAEPKLRAIAEEVEQKLRRALDRL